MLEFNLHPSEQLADARKKCYVSGHPAGSRRTSDLWDKPDDAKESRGGTSYEELRETAKNHFAPRFSVYKARPDFTPRFQEKDDTVDEYLTVLRTLTADCNFGETLDEQLVAGCAERKTQRELLANVDLNLKRVTT